MNKTDESIILGTGTIMGNQPCIKGTRITQKTIDQLVESGVSLEEIVTNYYPWAKIEIKTYLTQKETQ